MHRPMRAALRPISPRSRNGASAGSRPARLPNVTAALPPSQPARRTKPQQLLFRLHRRPQRRSGQTVCGGGGAFVPRREATPKLRPPAHSLRSSPLPSSPLWHLASPHLWPVGRTDGRRTPPVFTNKVVQRRLGRRQELVPLPGKPRLHQSLPPLLSNSDAG